MSRRAGADGPPLLLGRGVVRERRKHHALHRDLWRESQVRQALMEQSPRRSVSEKEVQLAEVLNDGVPRVAVRRLDLD